MIQSAFLETDVLSLVLSADETQGNTTNSFPSAAVQRLEPLTGAQVSQDINVVALVKGEERYIFLFNDDKKSETLRTLGRYASDGKLSFSWYDAAVLSQKVRNIEKTDAVSESRGGRFSIPEVEDLFSGGDLFSGEDIF